MFNLISEGILIWAVVITGISARPVTNLVIKASGILIFKNNSTFLGEYVMLRSTNNELKTDARPTSVNIHDSDMWMFISNIFNFCLKGCIVNFN